MRRFPFPGRILDALVFSLSGRPFWHGAIYEGESTQSCEARFSPSSFPFPGTQLLQVVECVNIWVGRWILRCWLRKVEPIYADVNVLAKHFLFNPYEKRSAKQTCF